MNDALLSNDEIVIFDSLQPMSASLEPFVTVLRELVQKCSEQRVGGLRRRMLFGRVMLPIQFTSLADLQVAVCEHVNQSIQAGADFVNSRPGARFRCIVTNKGTRFGKVKLRIAGVYSSSNSNDKGSVIFTIAAILSDGITHWANFVRDDTQ